MQQVPKLTMLCSFTITILLINYLSFGQPAAIQKHKIDSLFSQWNSEQNPGMQLLFLKNGKPFYGRGYGLSNIELKKPNSVTQKIWVASMSKQFTALAIALLIHQNKIDLEDDIRKYLPELPFLGDTIRIRHLVYHTSGLRDGFILTAMSFRSENEYSNQNVLKYLTKQTGRNFRPGDRFEYNNGGYVLLAAIVERVSGQTFPEFMQERIFAPLQMSDSRFYGQFPVADTSVTVGYSVRTVDDRLNYQPAWFKGNTYGSTGLVTTAEDLAKWDRVFYEPMFGQRIQQLQVTPGVLNNGDKIPYAFGIEIENYKGRKAISHSGADPGFKSEMIRFPDQQFTVICLANTENAYNNTDRLFKVAELFIDFNKEKTLATNGNCQPNGIYLNMNTLASMRFVNTNGTVTVASSASGDKQPLESYRACQFRVRGIETDQYEFRGDTLNYVTRATEESLYRVKKVSPVRSELQERSGNYFSEELGVSYHVFEKAGVLYLKFFDLYDVPLTAYDGDLFIGDFIGTNVLHFSTDKSGKIVGMEFNREGIRDLIFTRETEKPN